MEIGALPTHWLLVRTQPQRERYAQQNIQHWLSIDTYLPLYYDSQHDKTKVLFPSYLFVRSLQWHALKGCWGVSNVVMIGEEPARLAHKQIEELRKREARDGVIHLPEFSYKLGQKLRVLTGHFAEHLGLYDGMDGKDRVRVLIEFMSRKTSLILPTDAVSIA